MATTNKTILTSGTATFEQMIQQFGVVTVMNAKIYEIDDSIDFSTKSGKEIRDAYIAKTTAANGLLATIDTLKIANINIEGPDKTVTGGQYSNPLIKFGKTARLEAQDALGRADAIQAFGGTINEYTDDANPNTTIQMVHFTEDFAPTRLMIGDSFFIDRKTGQQVKVNIVLYQVLPDSIINLSQDAEGDATVFDLNADLLTTTILVPDKNGNEITHGVFYSILPEYVKPTTEG